MDSLFANYASSDEEEEEHRQSHGSSRQHDLLPPSVGTTQPSSKASSLFYPLPKPQSSASSSLFSSLPLPKSSQDHQLNDKEEEEEDGDQQSERTNSAKLFSSLPPPKTLTLTTPDVPLPPTNPKRVVQFRPPLPQPLSKFEEDDDDDDDDKEEEEEEEDEGESARKKQKQVSQDTSVKSFLSTMPTPKNSGTATLGALPPLGSGRRSIIDTEGPTSSSNDVNGVENEVGFESDVGVDGSNTSNYEVGIAGDQSYASFEGYGNYESYGNYGNNWENTSLGVESFVHLAGGKRRKDQAPTEIVEVKQDELMKNRPREDQSKLTGIAFGPSYQPTSSKGKLSKLHKRKHQIGSLYFDLKQKEMELAERRARGFLTKAQTQAKYGW